MKPSPDHLRWILKRRLEVSHCTPDQLVAVNPRIRIEPPLEKEPLISGEIIISAPLNSPHFVDE